MTQIFKSWTEYNTWLIGNYDKYAVTSLNEENGEVTAEYIDKSEWDASKKSGEDKKN